MKIFNNLRFSVCPAIFFILFFGMGLFTFSVDTKQPDNINTYSDDSAANTSSQWEGDNAGYDIEEPVGYEDSSNDYDTKE